LLRVPVPGGRFEASEDLWKKKNVRKTPLLCDAGCIIFKKLGVGCGRGSVVELLREKFPRINTLAW